MFNNVLVCLAICLFTVILAGCSEVQDNLHEPGVYKGKIDPFLAKSGDEQSRLLAERFNSIQTDR